MKIKNAKRYRRIIAPDFHFFQKKIILSPTVQREVAKRHLDTSMHLAKRLTFETSNCFHFQLISSTYLIFCAMHYQVQPVLPDFANDAIFFIAPWYNGNIFFVSALGIHVPAWGKMIFEKKNSLKQGKTNTSLVN